jgi:hypothetical protein
VQGVLHYSEGGLDARCFQLVAMEVSGRLPFRASQTGSEALTKTEDLNT